MRQMCVLWHHFGPWDRCVYCDITFILLLFSAFCYSHFPSPSILLVLAVLIFLNTFWSLRPSPISYLYSYPLFLRAHSVFSCHSKQRARFWNTPLWNGTTQFSPTHRNALPCTYIRWAGKSRTFATGLFPSFIHGDMVNNCTVTHKSLFIQNSIDIVNSDFSITYSFASPLN